jgi:hypothetical protein
MIIKFAPNSDIKTLVEEKQISTAQFKRILSRKGIFHLVRNSDELSNQIYPMFFGTRDLNRIQDVMQSANNYKKSSIMSIESTDGSRSAEEFLEDINIELQAYRSKRTKYKIEEIIKDKDGVMHIKLTYAKTSKGKMELLKTKTKEINIMIKKGNDSGQLLIDVRQMDNSDLKEFDMFLKEISQDDPNNVLFKINYITLDKLTKESKIKFFDELIACKYSDWKLEDIKGVDVKKAETEPDEAEGETGELVTIDDLAGINSAIFKGDSIRDTGIVKKFEEQGFYFISMKFKYEYIKSFESFIIDINFKGTTENVKIDIIRTYERDENDRELVCILPTSDQEVIIQTFQNKAFEIYKKLIKSQSKK